MDDNEKLGTEERNFSSRALADDLDSSQVAHGDSEPSAGVEIPEGATLRPLLRGKSEYYGGSDGYFVYTTTEGSSTEPTNYSLLRYGKTAEGITRTDVIDNKTGEALATIELRPGVRGAVLITSEGESTHLTATAALGSLMDKASRGADG